MVDDTYDDLCNRNDPCPEGGKHQWIGDDHGDSWCEKCGEVLFEK